jgi:hypothetical protein
MNGMNGPNGAKVRRFREGFSVWISPSLRPVSRGTVSSIFAPFIIDRNSALGRKIDDLLRNALKPCADTPHQPNGETAEDISLS